jgi:hypothetical protein
MKTEKEEIIGKLRQDILRWEGFRPRKPGESGSFGLGPMQSAFPNGGFPTGAIHEFISSCPEETAATGGFIVNPILQVTNTKLRNSEDMFLSGAMSKANIQVKRMSSIINGFLNISRLESGKILIDKSTFNLEQVIREVIAETN